jgi:hypothetical protein
LDPAGPHLGQANRSSLQWTPDPDDPGSVIVAGWEWSGEEEQRATYSAIPVERCIYCRSATVEIAFVFIQPKGLKVAVPGRVGLCATCHRLLRNGDLEAVLERTREMDLADFGADEVLDLIRASRTALP